MIKLDELDNTVIIAPNITRAYFLLIREENPLLNFKIYTKEELLSAIYGKVSIDAVNFLINKFNLDYLKAKKYISYIEHGIDGYSEIEQIKIDLENNGYIERDSLSSYLFKNNKIIFISYAYEDVEINKLIKKIDLKNYTFLSFRAFFNENENRTYIDFLDIDEEVKYCLNLVSDNLRLNKKIKIICDSKKYEYYLKIFSHSFHLKLFFKSDTNLFITQIGKILYKLLINDINLNLEEYMISNQIELSKMSGYYEILDLIKKYKIDSINNKILNFKLILQRFYIKNKEFTNQIEVVNQIEFDKNYHYILLGASESFFPSIKNDLDFLDDEEKIRYELSPSIDHNNLINDLSLAFLNFENLDIILFHQLESNKKENVSFLIKSQGYKPISPELLGYEYSKELSKAFCSSYDNYLNKFYIKKAGYDAYKKILKLDEKYDHKYTRINDHITSKKEYSYSMMNDYFSCPFFYYCARVLKISSNEDSFNLKFGKFAHKIMEHVYDNDLSFEDSYGKYIEEYQFDDKEMTLLKSLTNELKQVFNFIRIRKIEQSIYNTYKEVDISVSYKDDIKFNGKIDSIVLLDKNYLYVVDYKTGIASFDKEGIKYGLSLQLPAYYFLLKNSEQFKEYDPAGLYIQNLTTNSIHINEEVSADEYLLKGYTLNNDISINLIDNSLNQTSESIIVDRLKKNKNGQYSKSKTLITKNELDNMNVEFGEVLERFDKELNDNNFSISPLKYNNKIKCDSCEFKDICFKKESDVVDINNIVVNEDEED